ncbi:TIGR03013 family PEP-CTERM/XrtA system glycosyltransferase [Exilibacterium tricleocarpae]|uniref:TIGR03013 family PEP-CTERM/XrtA system glycosyltransferase n=1 Tax=Exilibacterium tricleocarpae TaxID=2591008 RepID=A0A545T3I1_9GAMM|nr:TIGR03013 family XrtA/PEP-CTERM system glycosyltransferase [Exilibacterium tricleocarpae]TQV71779.1 TIGR03013 family PEP-CTERM/XrtA system glycosyltransferase [Exilibacterium tricleocarpae]
MSHVRIFNHYFHIQYLILGLVEFGLLIVAVYLASGLRFGFNFEGLVAVDGLLERGLMFAAVMSCCTLAMGVYLARYREGFVSMALRTVVSYCLLGGVALTVLYYLFPYFFLGRGVLFWAVMVGIGLVLLSRWVFFQLVDIKKLKRRVLIYGSGRLAQQLLDSIAAERNGLGVDVVGCLVGERESSMVDGKYLIPFPDNWLDFVHKHHISEIVVAPDERRRSKGGSFPLDELLDCKLDGVKVTDAISFYERELVKIEIDLLHPGWMLFTDGFRHSRMRDYGKRLFDVVISVLLLLISWPFMLLAAAAVYLETGRPLLYSQERVGLNGRVFRIYKFRSMRQDAEKEGKAIWAQRNDSRVTRVGAFIRNTRLDELPQLYNVLRGDMSFVGPRPERPQFVSELIEQIPFYDARHRVKPGLMGWAQLKYPYGASTEDARHKLRYDLYYSKNHSFLMDLLILIQTVEVILIGKGVH